MNVFPIINLKTNVSKTKIDCILGCFTNYQSLYLKNCGEYRSRTDDLYGASVAL